MARTFAWTDEKERAAQLLLTGRWTAERIATALGTTRRTVEGWQRRPAFQARLEALRSVSRQRWDETWRQRLDEMARIL